MLTPDGRVAAFAHGARKSYRRFGGALEPFSTIEVELVTRRVDGMPTLSSASVTKPRLGLTSDLERLALASYETEISMLLAPEGAASGEIFDALEASLETLLGCPATLESRVEFELRLFATSGYRPTLDRCARCALELKELVFIDLAEGGALCGAHEAGVRVGPRTLAWLRAVLDDDPTRSSGEPGWSRTAAQKVLPILHSARRQLLPSMPKSEQLLADVGLDRAPPATHRTR